MPFPWRLLADAMGAVVRLDDLFSYTTKTLQELQVCQSYSLFLSHTVYSPLQDESPSLSKCIHRLKQGEGRN